MKHGIFFRIDPEQVEHIKQQKNQSQYINELVKADQHRQTRRDYVWPIVEAYAVNNAHPDTIISLIADLSVLLTDAITGKDVLSEIMEGGNK